MKRTALLFIILIFTLSETLGQSALLEQDVLADTIQPNNGPNYKNFTHWHFNFGLILGKSEGEGADILYEYSHDLQAGLRYKRKISGFYALGFEINYDLTSFRIDQKPGKTFITAELYDKQKLIYNNIELQIYQRFNFGKRGNYIGKYIDLGSYGSWGFNITHFTTERNATVNGHAKLVETSYKQLPFANPLNYGVSARMGSNKWALFGKYRLSYLFKNIHIDGIPTKYTELPRLIVGIEIGIINN